MEWKFQSVDPGSLSSALSSCKGSIDHGTTDSLASGISDSSWSSSSKDKLTKMLGKMGGSVYKNLESALDQYMGVAALLAEYKKLEKEYKELEEEYAKLAAEYAGLEPKLWIEKTRSVIWYDKYGTSHKGTEKYRVKDAAVDRRMGEIRTRQSEIRKRQKEIEEEAEAKEKQILASV